MFFGTARTSVKKVLIIGIPKGKWTCTAFGHLNQE